MAEEASIAIQSKVSPVMESLTTKLSPHNSNNSSYHTTEVAWKKLTV